MHHIHTSIVSRHLATRGNNKIWHTPPRHISSSEEILPRLTRHTLAQLRTNKSPRDLWTDPSAVTELLTSGHTTLHTVHHEHTTLSPHRRCERTLHSLALVHWWPQRTTNSRCHQQLGPHNTKRKHLNQSAKYHTTTNIITRHHHGV